MKLDATLWKSLFEPAKQIELPEYTQNILQDLRFPIVDSWNILPQNENLSYFLLPEEKASVSIQRMIPDSSDYATLDPMYILHLFADGLKDGFANYHPQFQQECEGVFGEHTPAYGFRYTITVNDTQTTNCSILFSIKHAIYCITFSDTTRFDLFPYGISFLKQLYFTELSTF